MRSFFLSWVHEEVVEAPNDPVSLRQVHALDISWEPARKLPGAFRSSNEHGSILAGYSLKFWAKYLSDQHWVPGQLLFNPPHVKNQVFLQKRPGTFLLQVHSQAHSVKARGYQLFAKE